MGGPAIVLAALVPTILLAGPVPSRVWLFFGAGAVGMAAVGLADDLLKLRPATKLIAQIACASLPVYAGLEIPRLHPILSVVASILWIVGITNAMNLLDNMDGLSAGVAAMAAATLAVHGSTWGNPMLTAAAAALGGACVGFLLYNFHPASIFMGDTGSLFIGYSLGVLSLIDMKARPLAAMSSLVVPVFVFLVPIFDTTLVTVARLVSGRSPAQGGSDHSSHRLVSLGIPERKAVVGLWALAATGSAASLALPHLPAFLFAGLALVAVLAIYYFGAYLGSLPIYKNDPAALSKAQSAGFLLIDTFVAHKTRVVEVAVDALAICASYLAANLLRWEGTLSDANSALVVRSLAPLIALRLVCFFGAGVYRTIPGSFSITEFLVVVRGTALSSLSFVAFLVFSERFHDYSRAVIVLDTFLVVAAVSTSRIATRSFAELLDPFREKRGRRVLILGAGQLGEAALRLLKYDRRVHWEVVGFLDDGPDKIGRHLHGKQVLGPLADLARVVEAKEIQEVVLAITSLDRERRREIREGCEQAGVVLRTAGII
jgi:UDP-GlcNAc:undecaprenyl-phosphate/decaprenyl-phosphate GlcNAc-1-phosphate transferase